MPAILLVLAALRSVLFSSLWTVRVALWRIAPAIGPATNIWWKPAARVSMVAARRIGWRPGIRATRWTYYTLLRIDRAERLLHAEVGRRGLWRPLFALSVYHDARTLFGSNDNAPTGERVRVEFDTANGHVSFWSQRRERQPHHVYGGARYRQRRSRPAIAR